GAATALRIPRRRGRAVRALRAAARRPPCHYRPVILQPGEGPIDGRHYLRSRPDTVHWGELPARATSRVLEVESGDVVTIDTVSHEGILAEFDHDPVTWFGAHGIARNGVLDDAIDIARNVRPAVGNGPHVVTGPIAVQGAEPGDMLRVDVLRTQ